MLEAEERGCREAAGRQQWLQALIDLCVYCGGARADLCLGACHASCFADERCGGA
jgi:hypothetical protein